MPKQIFVFHDKHKRRFARITTKLSIVICLINILGLFLLFCLYKAVQFDSPDQLNTKVEIEKAINKISTNNKDIIEVGGEGILVGINIDSDYYEIERFASLNNKEIILTFDDGPQPVYTEKILDILKKENVKAIFFVVGENVLKYPDIVRRIIKEGHQIGVHTFTHTKEDEGLNQNKLQTMLEIDAAQKIIEAETGYKTRLFRIPYWGVENTISLNSLILSVNALSRGYTIVSSTIDSNDWRYSDPDLVIKSAFNPLEGQVILMHDGGGDRTSTIKALPYIISLYKDNFYNFRLIDGELAGNLQELLKPISLKEKIISKAAKVSLLIFAYINKFLRIFFIFGIGIFAVNGVIYLSLILSKTFKRNKLSKLKPFVSVIIPAYNEEYSIAKTVNSVINSKYPRFEAIVIDNNSKDATGRIILNMRRRLKIKNLRLFKEKIQGKYAALNKGIKVAKGRIVLIIDADTQVLPNTIQKMVAAFSDKKIGAVGGNIKVGNIKNLISAFQAIEYIVGLNLDRRAYSNLGAIPVVPGALGAWRKTAATKAGGFLNDTLTEDAEMTVRIQKLGYKTVFAPDAVAYTEAPDNIRNFVRQRFRWTFGTLQVLYKHRESYFKKDKGMLFLLILPFLIFLQLPFMLLAPFVDIIAIATLFINYNLVVTFFLYFLAIHMLFNIIAFILAKEKRIWLLLIIPLSRFYYQPVWYFILYKSIVAILKGEIYPWNKLNHVGSVIVESNN